MPVRFKFIINETCIFKSHVKDFRKAVSTHKVEANGTSVKLEKSCFAVSYFRRV